MVQPAGSGGNRPSENAGRQNTSSSDQRDHPEQSSNQQTSVTEMQKYASFTDNVGNESEFLSIPSRIPINIHQRQENASSEKEQHLGASRAGNQTKGMANTATQESEDQSSGRVSASNGA